MSAKDFSLWLAPLAMYARLGWRVFPCRLGGKQPCIKDYHNVATTDMAQVKAWMNRFGPTNWAVSCGSKSALCVIDLDGRDAWRRLSALEKAFGALPRDAGLQMTPSGNAHLFFRFPSGFSTVSSTQTRLAKGVELKADLSSIMLSPSVIDESLYRFYVWAEDWDDIEQAYARLSSLPELPSWVALLAQTPKINPTIPPQVDASRSAAWLSRFVASQGSGNRNNALYWAALRAAEGGIGLKEALSTLALAAEVAGLNAREAVRTIESAYQRLSMAA